MKNLVLGRVDYTQNGFLEDGEDFAEDAAENLVWLAKKDSLLAVDVNEQIVREFAWKSERGEAEVIDLQLFYDSGEIGACLSDGSILVVNAETGEITRNELSPTLTAAAWSPDFSILAVADGYAITFFDRFFEMISMCELNTSERGKDEQVTVGWGSKETQFQGSAGKAAREKPVEINRKAYEDDSGQDQIKWRADGQVVLVSYRDQESGERNILVFNKDGELLSRLKNTQPLEEGFAIKPVGNYIVTTTRTNENARKMIFFERNGEKRHEFDLPSGSDSRIIDVSWDMGGTALMMVHQDRVELWTVSNYDWTFKWAHDFKAQIRRAKWDGEQALTLVLLLEDGTLIRLFFSQNYSRFGSSMCVASSDGFRMTNFARALIPPPMFEYKLTCPNKQAFTCDNSRIVVIHPDWSISGYADERLNEPTTLKIIPSPKWSIISSPQLIQNDLYFVANGSLAVRVDLATGEWFTLPSISTESIVSLFEASSSLFALTTSGRCYQFGEDWQEVFRIPESTSYDVKTTQGKIAVLTSSNELFLDGKSVMKSVRSFLLAAEVCVYITLQNQIFFADIANGFRSLDKVRSVELGSELVNCVPEKMSLIMQMPRGNLETIFPRIFVVQKTRSCVEKLDYVEALRVMKKHRINMNILVDYDYDIFTQNCRRLFGEDSAADLVDLFVASVSNEMSEFCEGKVVEGKVEKVSELIEKSVLELDESRRLKFFTVLLSALLKPTPPDVEKALQYIKQHTDKMNSEDRDHYSRLWLHHVGFFVPEKAMFNAALATYDLHLTVQVAEASNRDPKEYLPLLNELRRIEPEQYRKYRIQMIREDWTAALRELAELPDKIEEAVGLLKTRQLYSPALRIFNGKEHFKVVAEVVASFLETKGQWHEAGFLFEKIGREEKALGCLEMSRDVMAYREAAARFSIADDVLVTKFRKMAIQLEGDGKFEEAYRALRFAKAPTAQLVQLLSRSCQWREAAELARNEPTSRQLLEAAGQSRAEFLLSETEKRMELLTKYAERLEVVRNIKEQKILNLKEGLESGRDLEDIDAFSEAGSTISLLSRKTGKTGVSRASTTATQRKRKQIERKKQSLKEGGEYEDSALLLSLQDQYKWIAATADEVRKLLLCMVELDLYQEAANLQTTFEKFCQLAKYRLQHIWPPRILPKHLCGPLQLIYTIDDVFTFPEDGGMPKSVVIEPEMTAPTLVDCSSWQLVCLQ